MRPQRFIESGVGRSILLAMGFAVEQTNPDYFYGLLARDSVRMIAEQVALAGATVLDVGAGPRQVGETFLASGSNYVGFDHDPDALEPLKHRRAAALVGSGESLPVRTNSVDIAFCSNVFEHVLSPETLCDEVVRVVKPGGFAVVSYTNWLSPWGGHETSPFHYFGGRWAIDRYTRHYGFAPKNRVDETLFRTSVAQGLAWARSCEKAEMVEARPRYYPRWARAILRIPALREVVTWNLWLVLKKR